MIDPNNIDWILSHKSSSIPGKDSFLSDPGVPGVRSMGPDVSQSLHTRPCADLTDMTLADEESNSTPADDVNRAIRGNVAMQVLPPGGQT